MNLLWAYPKTEMTIIRFTRLVLPVDVPHWLRSFAHILAGPDHDSELFYEIGPGHWSIDVPGNDWWITDVTPDDQPYTTWRIAYRYDTGDCHHSRTFAQFLEVRYTGLVFYDPQLCDTNTSPALFEYLRRLGSQFDVGMHDDEQALAKHLLNDPDFYEVFQQRIATQPHDTVPQ